MRRGFEKPPEPRCVINFHFPTRITDAFQPGEGAMRRVGLGGGDPPPTDQTPRPVATAGLGAADELPVLHRLPVLPSAFGVAVIGNARLGAAPRPGQHEEATAGRQQVHQGVELRIGTRRRHDLQSTPPSLLCHGEVSFTR